METRHVKLDYEEALNSKKELLNMQLNFLKVAKKIKSYGALRKKELALKNGLRVGLVNFRTKSQLFLSSLPGEPLKKNKVRKKVNGSSGDEDFHQELEDIKQKLERLG